MGKQAFNYEMVFRANTAAAKAAVKDLSKDVDAATKGADKATNTASAKAKKQTKTNTENAKQTAQALRRAKDEMRPAAAEAEKLAVHTADVFSALANGGQIPRGAMRGVVAALAPVGLAVGSVAVALGAGAIAWNGYLKSVKEVETAGAGLGRATAASAFEMEAAARAGAAAAGISMKSARIMQTQFLRTGRIGSENFADLIGLSKDFAATLGIETAAAGSALASMFADPANAADILYQKYGLIDAATARHARNLANQNRASEAQAVLIKALPDRLADAEKATTALGRAWDSVKQKASDAGNVLGSAVEKAVSGPTDADKISAARVKISELEQLLKNPPKPKEFLTQGIGGYSSSSG